jgi:hypothetical protein
LGDPTEDLMVGDHDFDVVADRDVGEVKDVLGEAQTLTVTPLCHAAWRREFPQAPAVRE